MQIEYKVTTLSPVLLTSDSGEINTVNTNEYIPGNSILGIFAAKYIKDKKIENAHQDQNFQNFFLNGNLKFSNAYITVKNNDKEYIAYPIPFSVQKEKNSENVIDLIHNDDTDIQTNSINGFGYIKEENIYYKQVDKIINFHNSIKEEQIFHYSAIKERQTFKGKISGSEEELEKFMNNFAHKTEAYIGRSKSSQYGKVLIEFTKSDTKKQSVGSEVVLTLISDTIIFNENGFSTTDISDFKKFLGHDIEIEKAFIKSGQTENFVGIWKLRKPSENCFLAGSCFKLNLNNDESKKHLSDLVEKGIGERTHEGFGQFLINYQQEEELELYSEKEEIKKPKNLNSEITNNILKFAIHKNITEEIKLLALQEMTRFTRPTNSLLGKLRLILSETNNPEEFRKKVRILRKIAKDKLESCNNGKKTLYEFINDIDLKAVVQNNVISQYPNLKKLLEEVNYQPREDEDFTNKLSKIYFDTFFANMIKENNKKELANAER